MAIKSKLYINKEIDEKINEMIFEGVNQMNEHKCSHETPCPECSKMFGINIVNHPSWYKGSNGIEVVQIIDGFNLDFFTGAAIKYICRAGKKDKQKEIEDYRKAIAFLEMKIERVSK